MMPDYIIILDGHLSCWTPLWQKTTQGSNMSIWCNLVQWCHR